MDSRKFLPRKALSDLAGCTVSIAGDLAYPEDAIRAAFCLLGAWRRSVDSRASAGSLPGGAVEQRLGMSAELRAVHLRAAAERDALRHVAQAEFVAGVAPCPIEGDQRFAQRDGSKQPVFAVLNQLEVHQLV